MPPIPPSILSGLISGGANLIGQGIGAAGTSAANRQQRLWNEKMYNMQRRDALSDWATQNAYNSPEQQMKRFKEAGLNPNLIYGQGSSGDAGAVRSSSVESYKPTPITFNPGEAASQYFDTQMSVTQMESQKLQQDIMKEEVMNKVAERENLRARTASSLTENDRKKFDLNLQNALLPYTTEYYKTRVDIQTKDLDIKNQQYRKLIAETNFINNENDRKQIANSTNVQLTIAKIATEKINQAKSKEEIQRIKADVKKIFTAEEYQRWELDQLKQGKNKNDPWYIRQAKSFMSTSPIEKYLPK